MTLATVHAVPFSIVTSNVVPLLLVADPDVAEPPFVLSPTVALPVPAVGRSYL